MSSSGPHVPPPYQISHVLGSGSFGTVYAGVDKTTGRPVALKHMSFPRTARVAQLLVREVRLLRQLKHPCVVDLLAAVPGPRPSSSLQSIAGFSETDNDSFFLVFELLSTDLGSLLESFVDISDQHQQLFGYQLLMGIKFLASAGVIHRDLRPSNILINLADLSLRIADLGSGRTLAAGSEPMNLRMTTMDETTTVAYRAPEGLTLSRHYTSAVDIWSVGCILAEVSLRSPLFGGDDAETVLHSIVRLLGPLTREEIASIDDDIWREEVAAWNDQYADSKAGAALRQRLHGTAPSQAADLIASMLRFRAADRISIEDALRHPFLRDLHDVDDEPVAESVVDRALEEALPRMSLAECRKLLIDELQSLLPAPQVASP